MRPPCEVIVRYILPAFRSLVAKELLENFGLTQAAAAKKLGTTQAAVSYYFYSKRGMKYIEQLGTLPTIKFIVRESAEGIASNRISPADAISKFCKLCADLRTQDLICNIHKDLVLLPDDCKKCLSTIKPLGK